MDPLSDADLDAIEQGIAEGKKEQGNNWRVAWYGYVSAKDVDRLVAEVRRLRARQA